MTEQQFVRVRTPATRNVRSVGTGWRSGFKPSWRGQRTSADGDVEDEVDVLAESLATRSMVVTRATLLTCAQNRIMRKSESTPSPAGRPLPDLSMVNQRSLRRGAIARPGGHKLSALFENVSATVGALHPIAHLMPHGFFNHRMPETSDFLGPGAECRAESMSGDRTPVSNVCSATIWMGKRIASPRNAPEANRLPQQRMLLASLPFGRGRPRRKTTMGVEPWKHSSRSS